MAVRRDMGKTRVENFDPSVCLGEHPEVDGPCPHLVPSDADTGRGVIDRLRRVETAALSQVTDVQDGTCALCGCPLVNLGALDFAPDDCPRLSLHNR